MLMEKIRRVKGWFLPREGEIVLAAVIILTALASFGLGRLSALGENKFPIKIESSASAKATADEATKNLKQTANLFVASKNGQVFHLPSCPGAKQIKEENKIYFSSKEEAEKAGFRPAANCEGL